MVAQSNVSKQCGRAWDRTRDRSSISRLLYQLSYTPFMWKYSALLLKMHLRGAGKELVLEEGMPQEILIFLY